MIAMALEVGHETQLPEYFPCQIIRAVRIYGLLTNSSRWLALVTDMSIGCLSVILNIGVGMTQSEVAVDALSLLHAAGDGGGGGG